MTHETFNSMLESINREINYGVFEFKNNGSSDWYNRIYARICGMIEIFRIATDDNYYFDENGLHYENGEIVTPKTDKRVLSIEGYSNEPAAKGTHNIMVRLTDETVLTYHDLNCAEYPVTLDSIRNNPHVVEYVVSDSVGAYIYGENDIIREGDAPITTPEPETEPAKESEPEAPTAEPEPAKESTAGLYSVSARFKNARRNSRRPYDRKGIVWANSRDEAIARFVKSSYGGSVPENVFVDALFWGDIVYTF